MGKPKAFPELATQRLRLRRFRDDDVEGLHACFGDADAMRYWNTPPTTTRVATARKVRALAKANGPSTWLGWAVAGRRNDRCIGMINYHHREVRHRRLEIGYILAPSQQGKGYMTEALRAVLGYCFADLDVHRVEALIDPDNAASIRLVERAGFEREGGPLRDFWRVRDSFRSVLVYALLADEFVMRGGKGAR